MTLNFETREQLKEAATDYLKKRGVKRVGSRQVFKAEETEKGIEVCGGDAIRYYFDDKEPEELPSSRACITLPKEFFSQLKGTFDPPGEGDSPMTTEEIQTIAVRAAETVLENRVPEEPAPKAVTKQEECACPNLQPMAEWVKGEEPGTCRPCMLGPVVQWYYLELKEQGDEETAAQLEAEVDVLEEDNVEQVMALCKDLDEIKAAAPPELRKRLEEFDCSIQFFDPDEFSDEVQTGDSPSSSPPLAHSSDSESISPL